MTNATILDIIGRPAAAEQFAEECVELAHAALKYARAIRKENPTPVNQQEAWDHLREEFDDMLVCGDVVGVMANPEKMWEKRQRWVSRLKEMQGSGTDDARTE